MYQDKEGEKRILRQKTPGIFLRYTGITGIKYSIEFREKLILCVFLPKGLRPWGLISLLPFLCSVS